MQPTRQTWLRAACRSSRCRFSPVLQEITSLLRSIPRKLCAGQKSRFLFTALSYNVDILRIDGPRFGKGRRQKGWNTHDERLAASAWNAGILGSITAQFWRPWPHCPHRAGHGGIFFPPLPLIAIVALNVAAHGGLLGFLYSWAGVALGGSIMFLLWRRVVKRFFWKFASRSPKLEKLSNG